LIVFALKYNSESESTFYAKILDYEKFTFPKKEWNIKFSKSVDDSTINDNNIFILNSNGEKHSIELEYSKKDKVVTIIPKEKYLSWEIYTVIINENVKSKNEEELTNPLNIEFDMLENTYNSGINDNYCEFESTGVVYDEEDFYNELKYALENFESELELEIKNSDENDYNINILNEICDDIPLLNYGFKSIKGETVKDSFGKEKMSVKFEYRLDVDELKKMKKIAQEKSDEIINNIIEEDMEDWEKELVIHDYIINNCVYDRDENEFPPEDYTDYGVFVNQIAVCEGYAKAMYRMLNSLGIRCMYVVGEAERPHAWNIVQIDNNYYQVDSTWDDMPSIDTGEVLIHKYFNITNEELSKNHTWEVENYPVCTNTRFLDENIEDLKSNIYDISIAENKEEFINNLKEAIRNKKEKIVLKVKNYSEKEYDVEESIQNIIDTNSSINFYGKFSYTHPNELTEGTTEYIEVIFKTF
jgi:transglutaminase/protease-like cytokinesis protein 3